jgi:predicted deacylase
MIVTPPTPVPRATNALYVGPSTGERDILAYRYGDGDNVIMLVGGVHGGWEANTVTLMEELRAHFAANPDDIAPGFSVMIVPALNPDGLAVGADIQGRFNGAGVDLNRNWACGWEPEAVWREGPVDPGARPFSEIETRALAAFIQQVDPVAVLFYHSAASGVFAGDCPRRPGPNRSRELSAVYGDAAGYTSGVAFSAYPVSGTAPSWVDGLGIPSADVELSSSSDPQTERNLRAVLAVQCWLQGPACES